MRIGQTSASRTYLHPDEQLTGLRLLGEQCVQHLETKRFAFSRKEILEGVLDASPLAIVLLNTRGEVISWNRSAERIFGWRSEEVLNQPYPAVPEGREAEFDRTLAGMIKGTEYQFDTERRRKDGSTFPARIWAAAVRNPSGAVIGAVVLVEDMTGQIQMENSLLQLGAAVSASEDAIISEDLEGNIQSWAGAAEKIFGYSAKEVLGRNITSLLPPERKDDIATSLSRIRKGESFTSSEVQHVRKDGKQITVSGTFTPLRNSSGKITGVCVVVRDITSQIHIEQQLAQAQKMEAVGRLAGGVAHDFNNMLGVILGYAELAESNLPPDSPVKRSLEMIKTTAMRSGDLTRQLLAFSRKQVLEPTLLELDEVVTESQKMMSRVIGEHIELQFQLNAGQGRVRTDRSQLQQVLLNLAVNARDAMPEGGRLCIETYTFEGRPAPHMPEDRYLVIRISDTGSGIDQSTQEHMFEPFFTTKESGKGTGLGLSTVHGIVTQSGGHVAVHSEMGKGTTFEVYLPEVREKDQGERLKAVERQDSGGGATVLLVEDELSLRKIIAEWLRARGYRVIETENGERAVQELSHGDVAVDAIVTDVVMPKVSGKQVVRELRSRYPDLKVLYMSGYADGVLDLSDIGDRGVAFLAKPFTAWALTAALSKLMNQGENSEELRPGA